MESKLGIKIEEKNVAQIMTGKNRDRFMKYCTKIVNMVIKRNKAI